MRLAPLFAGCTDDLLPGESVVGTDIAAEVTYGEPDDRLGDSLAWNGSVMAAAAPGRPGVLLGGEVVEGPGAWVGYWGEALVRVGPSGATRDGEALGESEALGRASALAASSVGLYYASATAVHRYGGERVAVAGVIALAADETRVVALVCEPAVDCVVEAFTPELVPAGPVLVAGERLVGGADGILALEAGVVCVGDPELDRDDAGGRVRCEDGRELVGGQGDHVGRGIAAGYAAGVFNRWMVPPRARVWPIDGGEVLVVEVGAEGQVLTLAGDADTLFIGAPFHPRGGQPSGAVFTVPR